MNSGKGGPADDVPPEWIAEAPKVYAARFIELVGLTDAFCGATR